MLMQSVACPADATYNAAFSPESKWDEKAPQGPNDPSKALGAGGIGQLTWFMEATYWFARG